MIHLTREQQEALMKQAGEDQQDFHRLCAAVMFGVDYEDVDDAQRRVAKSQNFLYLYSSKAEGLVVFDDPVRPQQELDGLVQQWNDLEGELDNEATRSKMQELANRMKTVLDQNEDLEPGQLKTYSPRMFDLGYGSEDGVDLLEDYRRSRAYARRLALHMKKTFYSENPEFELLDDLDGVLSQIDNMVSGLRRDEDKKSCASTRGGTRWLYRCNNPDRPLRYTKHLSTLLDECPDCGGPIEEVKDL